MTTFGSYVILGSLSLIYFLENYNRYLIAVAVVPFINYSSYSYSLISGTVFALCYSAGGVILAIVNDSRSNADQNPAKLMKVKIYFLTIACVTFSTAFLLTGLSTNFAQLAVIRMIMGFAQSVVTPFCTGIIGEYFPDSLKGFAFSVFQVGVYFSFSLTLSLGTYMYDKYGWQYGYLLFGGIGIVLSLGIPFLSYFTPLRLLDDDTDSVDTFAASNVSFADDDGTRNSAAIVKEAKLWNKKNSEYSVVYEDEDFEEGTYYDVTCSDVTIISPGSSRAESKVRMSSDAMISGSPRRQPYYTLNSTHLPDFRSPQVSSSSATGPIGTRTGVGKKAQDSTISSKYDESGDNSSDISCSMGSAGSFVGDSIVNSVVAPAPIGANGGGAAGWRSQRDGSVGATDAGAKRMTISTNSNNFGGGGGGVVVYSPVGKRDKDKRDLESSKTDDSGPGINVTRRSVKDTGSTVSGGKDHEVGSAANDCRSSMMSVSLLSARDADVVRQALASKPTAEGSDDSNEVSWCPYGDCCTTMCGKGDDVRSNLGCFDRVRAWLGDAKDLAAEVFRSWNQQPVIYIICLATALRLGAGYIWSSYTSVYFADLLVENPTSLDGSTVNCLYSYNATAYATQSLTNPYPSVACGSDYPYCSDENSPDGTYTCYQVSDNAWMNKGMSHTRLEAYMSWVPLAGSAVGNVLGGILSDKLFPYFGSGGRCLVCGIGNIISVFFVMEALLSEFPNCFLFMIASGLFGECYLGQSIALLSDATSPRVIVTSVSIFMFIITVLAGNAPLLIPSIRSAFEAKFDSVTISVDAASMYPGHFPHESAGDGGAFGTFDSSAAYGTVAKFTVSLSGGGSRSLQWALIVAFVSLYVSSGLLYLLCFLKYRRQSSFFRNSNPTSFSIASESRKAKVSVSR
jgi:hypothetical protein